MKSGIKLAALATTLILSIAMTVACTSGGGNGADKTPTAPTATPTPSQGRVPQVINIDYRVTEANKGFAFNLFDKLAKETPGENLFVSPTSVAFALALIYNGAAGETRDAIAKVLEAQGMTVDEFNAANKDWLASLASADPKVQLAIANSLWYKNGVPVIPGFLQRTQQYYNAKASGLDFNSPQAADTINGWVSQQTRGKIDRIIEPPIDPSTIMFLINALYFKGEWTVQFDKARTQDGAFNLANGSQKQVPMMSRTGKMKYLKGQGFQAVSLPYGDGRFTMDVFLPDASSNLAAFLGRLDKQSWKDWVGEFAESEVALSLPRFKLKYEAKLNDVLTAMGMGVAFDPFGANFENLVPREWLAGNNAYLSQVKHKTFLEVNEEGSEAAAVTTGEIRATSAPMTVPFVVDRPFFLAIRDTQTGTLLFMGAVAEPE